MNSLLCLYRFLRPYGVQAVTALVLLFLMVAADLAIPRLTQRIIDKGILANDLDVVVTTALYMAGAALISMIFALANNRLSVVAALGFGANLRSALMRKVQSLSFGNLDHLKTGNLIVRSTSDVNTVQTIVILQLRIMTKAPVWAAGAIIMLALTSPRLALMAACFVPFIIGMMWIFASRSRQLFLAMQQRLDRLNTILQENLAGIRLVKAFVRTAHEITRFDQANQALMDQAIQVSRLTAVFMPLMLFALNLALIGAIWLGSGLVLSGGMTLGHMVASINYLGFALFPILLLGIMLGPLAAADASAGRILEVLDARPRVIPPASPVFPDQVKGRIAFEKVCFSYGTDCTEPVLKEISFVAEPGETVAVLGATGAGKSSLVHLIPRFYDVTAGRVTLDGIDVKDMDLGRLRNTVAMVLQETVLFSGTIRDNIRYGRMAATREEVQAAADAAQATAFIDRLPQGFDTPIGSRGGTLSGGQQQRIAIARALVVRPRVLILDDATSALDAETETRLQKALDQWAGSCQPPVTRLIVAQRISTVIHADKILLLDQGRISAAGTHAELLASSPIYQDIYRSQLQ
ncbi:ABC transporter ATP-binding protein [Desulfobacter sp.]|uniref:ABC transporter ATP-binding protein n=1 Tax=Desulfobacter sp. TaxID=2294 RepID=UPI003D0AEA6D